MRFITSVILLILAPVFAQGRELFVLRADFVANPDSVGIIRFDPETGTESQFASFLYRGGGPWGGTLKLTSTFDRIIAQGNAFYEFDLSSGQLLRRYPALAPPYEGWSFHGVAIDEPAAESLGIERGSYGAPICTQYGGICAPREAFPGYTHRTNVTDHHIFLARGFEPSDSSLRLINQFPMLRNTSVQNRRLPAFDARRKGFWFWLVDRESDYTTVERLTFAAVESGVFEDEVIFTERRPAGDLSGDHTTFSFTYDAGRDEFFRIVQYPNSYVRELVGWRLTGETTIHKRVPAAYWLDSVTSIPDEHPRVHTQLLPAIGDTPGANRTYWQSDAWFFNPSSEPMTVRMRRVWRPDVSREVTIGPKATVKISGILGEFGGGASRDGIPIDALVIDSPYREGAQLSVYSRTFTPSPNGGTYGQAIPALPSTVGYTNHFAVTTISQDMSETESAFLFDKRDPKRFRHNMGVVNPSEVPINLRLRYGVISANPLPDSVADLEKFVTVPPNSVRQFSIEGLFPSHVTEQVPPRVWVSADRPAVVWLSIIDNRTGDASFVPFTQYAIEVADSKDRLAFPAVANTPGANGTYWRTDVTALVSNRVALGEPQRPHAAFYPAPGAPCSAQQMRLTPTPGFPDGALWSQFWYTTFADVASQVCPGMQGIRGALEIATGSWMSGYSRTYTTDSDGGTYGEILPLYPPRGWPVRHFPVELSTQTRVNLGLYNGSDEPSKIELRLYTSKGEERATRTIDLGARDWQQLSLRELLGNDLADGVYGLSVITIEGVGAWPYVSTVDNVTGDPTNWW